MLPGGHGAFVWGAALLPLAGAKGSVVRQLHMLLPPWRLQAPRLQTKVSSAVIDLLCPFPRAQPKDPHPLGPTMSTASSSPLTLTPRESLPLGSRGWFLVSKCRAYVLSPFISLRGTSV